MIVNGVKSDWAPVLSGVPLGHRYWTSVILVVYLCYDRHYNSDTEDIDSEKRFFADDCYREIKDVEDMVKLQKNIDRLGYWAVWG